MSSIINNCLTPFTRTISTLAFRNNTDIPKFNMLHYLAQMVEHLTPSGSTPPNVQMSNPFQWQGGSSMVAKWVEYWFSRHHKHMT